MNDANRPRPRGPWDREPAVAPPAKPPVRRRTSASPGEDKGQGIGWAILSTVLLGGFIWFISGQWIIAVAIVFGVFVHEYGHVLAMNRYGMGPAKLYIVPFFGGLAKGQRAASSEWHGVLVSLAGPAVGLLAAAPFFALYGVLGGNAWLIGAAAIAALNLINLAPAPPLDGSKAIGPVLARIHPKLEQGAMILIGVLIVWWGISTGRWILAAFLCIALIGHVKRGAWRPEGRRLSARESWSSVGLFAATAAACAGVGLLALWLFAGRSMSGALHVAGAYLGIGA
jgi:Zn-dependent protease